MSLTQAPHVHAQMLIRRPVAEVFEAIVDPGITTRFWFTHSTGRLGPDVKVTWKWEMYGASAPVVVKSFVPNERIVIEWGEPVSHVAWTFAPRGPDATLVQIENHTFPGSSDDDVVAAAIDSMGGFAFVLAGLKAYLEHGIALNLVADHHPDLADTPSEA